MLEISSEKYEEFFFKRENLVFSGKYKKIFG